MTQTLGVTISLPAPPSGWFDYAYAALWSGDLALIRADRDVHAEHKRWYDTQGPYPHLWDGRLRLTIYDGSIESRPIEVPACDWPIVDRLSDGRWLLASPRAALDEHNAHLYAADGAPSGTFAIGDAIEHIQCAPDGTIWVGYFNEGGFSGPMGDGSWPISSSGLARFGPDGKALWHFDEGGDLCILDCYALTLEGTTLWCCPYPDFPIIRVEHNEVKSWGNEIAGAKALAVEGDLVLLAGGYGDQSDRLALLRLGDERARQIGEWRFQRSDRSAARLLQGRGDTLHIVEGRKWTQVSLATFR